MTTAKKRTGRPTATDPRIHRYNFKLTTEENIRFKKMLSEAGLEHNREPFYCQTYLHGTLRGHQTRPVKGTVYRMAE